MIWNYLFNPLAKIPAKPLLLLGIISVFFGSFISFYNHTIFDGIIDAHTYLSLTYPISIIANIIDIIIPCIILFIIGKFINSKTRMIDILNASFIYRVPIYILPFLTKLGSMQDIETKLSDPALQLSELQFSSEEIITLIVVTCISLGILAYAITLLFMSFKTATNAKKIGHYAAFVAAFVLCEILSKIAISYIL